MQIISLQARQSQLEARQNQLNLNQHQLTPENPLVNLIDARLRPNILGLNYKLFPNQDSDFDPLTTEERTFWTSLDPQERNLLLIRNCLACPNLEINYAPSAKTSRPWQLRPHQDLQVPPEDLPFFNRYRLLQLAQS